MFLFPLQIPRIAPGDDLIAALQQAQHVMKQGDIVAISSKAVATSEGRLVELKKLTPSKEALLYAEKTGRTPLFCQAVLEEVQLRNGVVRGTCPGAMVTEVRPWNDAHDSVGAQHAAPLQNTNQMPTILTANAGLDASNAPEGFAIGWPEDPVDSVRKIQKILSENRKGKIGVLITDSCVRPRRWGLIAFALTCAGFDPLKNEAGKEDLYGKPLRITQEAIADQLATAANFLMGNAEQSTPAVIIREHGIPFTDFCGWVPGIRPEEDLFHGIV